MTFLLVFSRSGEASRRAGTQAGTIHEVLNI
jgi:hypothetical protein